jgi:hypothetical protein
LIGTISLGLEQYKVLKLRAILWTRKIQTTSRNQKQKPKPKYDHPCLINNNNDENIRSNILNAYKLTNWTNIGPKTWNLMLWKTLGRSKQHWYQGYR